MRNHLGEFEELVMLTVGVLYNKAYAVAIRKYIAEQQGRKISIGALHTALYRLEKKGFLESRLGEPTKVRGGKPKRFFTVTIEGQQELQRVNQIRQGLWKQISPIAFPILDPNQS